MASSATMHPNPPVRLTRHGSKRHSLTKYAKGKCLLSCRSAILSLLMPGLSEPLPPTHSLLHSLEIDSTPSMFEQRKCIIMLKTRPSYEGVIPIVIAPCIFVIRPVRSRQGIKLIACRVRISSKHFGRSLDLQSPPLSIIVVSAGISVRSNHKACQKFVRQTIKVFAVKSCIGSSTEVVFWGSWSVRGQGHIRWGRIPYLVT
jgi:hypothetical protein